MFQLIFSSDRNSCSICLFDFSSYALQVYQKLLTKRASVTLVDIANMQLTPTSLSQLQCCCILFRFVQNCSLSYLSMRFAVRVGDITFLCSLAIFIHNDLKNAFLKLDHLVILQKFYFSRYLSIQYTLTILYFNNRIGKFI